MIATTARVALAVAQGWMATATAYLLALLLAGARRSDARQVTPDGEALALAVLVPAHDEESILSESLRALSSQEYPRDRQEVIVVADNCADATAAVAAAAGATVWERRHPTSRGKGQAIAWALERMWRERPGIEAVVFVDADCVASANLCAEVDHALRSGMRAVQVRYEVSNPQASPTAALRWAGFGLMHVIRPRGKMRLGLSCGLFGTGMAIRRDLLEERPWSAFSVTEDAEYHLDLVAGGDAVGFADAASVASVMPTTPSAARAQQLRWETGNVSLLLRAGRLLAEGMRGRDAVRVGAAIDRMVPPQSVLLAGSVLAGAGASLLHGRGTARLAALTVVGQAAYVVGGLATLRAPRSVWLALAEAPRLVVGKLAQTAQIAVGRGAAEWVRTTRD
jgi:1,2-diacylglycerol 3-beta-glucosyltransferase